jgi:DNA polymerase III epsilon subunit-like protein
MSPNTQEFIVVDVETSGIAEPVYVIEIGAQLLVDGKPQGEPFRRLINRDVDIDPHATRVHGYDRARLAREGDDPIY